MYASVYQVLKKTRGCHDVVISDRLRVGVLMCCLK
uniref:Uncharacterized protein n=1 Tax=Anguilla anguilla TaxID=7936 RepID=A0A0E9PBC8_ANGAN